MDNINKIIFLYQKDYPTHKIRLGMNLNYKSTIYNYINFLPNLLKQITSYASKNMGLGYGDITNVLTATTQTGNCLLLAVIYNNKTIHFLNKDGTLNKVFSDFKESLLIMEQ